MKVSKARLLSCAVILLLAAAARVAFLRPDNSLLAPVVVFPQSYQMPSPIPLFARWVPTTPAWAWLWHLKEAICGKIKPVRIDTDIMVVSGTLPAFGAPAFDGPGSLAATRLRVWLVDLAELESFRQQVKTRSDASLVSSPRMITGDGIGASLFVGETIIWSGATNETGVRVSYFTRLRPDLIDLTAMIGAVHLITNSALAINLRTNLEVNTRFQIPKGKGIFLLQSFKDHTNHDPMAVIISPKP